MSNDLNQCQFIGRVGKNVESRFMPDGKMVVNFSIAVGSQWKSKDGEKQESVEWINLVAFDKLAEICSKFLVKGTKIFASGKMKTRKYQDKEGKDRYATEVIVNEMQMLSGKQDGQTGNSAPAAQNKPAGSTTSKPGTGQSFNNFDDDIPF